MANKALAPEKRAYLKRVGVSEARIREIEESLENAAKEARNLGLEFKGKSFKARRIQTVKEMVLEGPAPAVVDGPAERAAQLVVSYLDRVRNSGTVTQAVMGPIFREEVVNLVSDEYVAAMEDADREQVRDAIRNRVMIMEGENE